MDNQGGQAKRRIFGERRRRPDSAPPGGRERAGTPQRREYPTGGTPTGGGFGTDGGYDSGGGLGGLGGLLGGLAGLFGTGGVNSDPNRTGGSGCLTGKSGCLMMILVIGAVLLVAFLMFSGVCSMPSVMDEFSDQSSLLDQSSVQDSSMSTEALSITPATSGQRWLVMLYQDADDRILEKDIYIDLNEAEKVGSSDLVKIVSQVDRYNGAYSGDGNWTGTKRFLIGRDDNLGRLRSQEIADLGEMSMSSGRTLVDFATWAIKTYPSDKYVLILSDHGMGWPGGWSDNNPKTGGDSSTPLGSRLGDLIYLNELDSALGQIRANSGVDKFELIGLDACLMGQLEVFTALEPHARYAVASEEVEPSLGWAYAGFLKELIENPNMTGAQLGHTIVDSYIDDDQRISDSSARADLLGEGSALSGLFGGSYNVSSQGLAREMGRDSTLSAVDLSKVGRLNSSLNQFAFTLQNANQQAVAGGRTYAQSFTSIFGSQVPPSYIDLGNFLQIVKQKSNNAQVNQAADAVLAAISQAVIAEKHGAQKPGATGMAIYFPNSQLYQNSIAGARSYTAIANRFAGQSLWDDFLAYHYTGRKFTLTDTQPIIPTGAPIKSPAAGGISISKITSSSAQADPRNPVILSADISGDNIGYIYLFAGYYDPQSNSIFVADQDYIESPDTRLVKGVYYPDWGKGEFTLDFNWEPIIFAIDDGTTRVYCLFKPESYGRSFAEAVYTVDGTYTYADSAEQCRATLYFSDGALRKVLGFTGQNEAGAPHEITPTTGDKFTVTESWLELDGSGNITNTVYQEGGTLTFGRQPLTWKTLDAAPGDYMVGFVVEDLDGNRRQSLTQVTVQ
ncbi:MAG: hypothetical protein JW901_11440 [Dehalococcoidia bacterium]|nr:hypothetical protein [Dehalococcoidia bacterium]